MNFMGADVLVSGNNVEKHIRDAIQLHAHGESLDNLRLYIGLAGLQHAGVERLAFSNYNVIQTFFSGEDT